MINKKLSTSSHKAKVYDKKSASAKRILVLEKWMQAKDSINNEALFISFKTLYKKVQNGESIIIIDNMTAQEVEHAYEVYDFLQSVKEPYYKALFKPRFKIRERS